MQLSRTLRMMENKKLARKILLIDDDADDRRYFIEAVNEIDTGIECVTANDGVQAMELLNNVQFSIPDYIFLDLRMPKINGRQCLVQIKSDERLMHIPVIVYTTSTELEESEEMARLGAVRFISKPSEMEEIYYVLSQVLEEQNR
jgi:CheY-like chemotaxis protein